MSAAAAQLERMLAYCEALAAEYDQLAQARARASWWRLLYRHQLVATMRDNIEQRGRLLDALRKQTSL